MAVNLNEIAKELELPFDVWFASRFGIVPELISRNMIDGEICYGMFIQDDAAIQHCWIMDGDTIYDPVRWAIDGDKPYLFVGTAGINNEYDLNGENYHHATQDVIPEFDPTVRSFYIETGTIESDLFVKNLFREPTDRLSVNQVEWLAKLSIDDLGNYQDTVHNWVTGIGYGSHIKK